MKLASLFSGGKDSTYAIYLAMRQNHDVQCLVSLSPKSEDSHLLHYPNMNMTSLQSMSMNIPQLLANTTDNSEDDDLTNLLIRAKKEFEITGIIHGGICSKYQKNRFEKIANNLDLEIFSPLWNIDSTSYLNQLLDNRFEFMITSVSSDGLDDSWLGRIIHKSEVEQLQKLSEKFGFNITFEGGEAETFVLNCPLFSSPIKIVNSAKIWDGYRGRFEIMDAVLNK